MTKKTTHDEQYNRNKSTLFMAFELGGTRWQLGFSIGMGHKARRRTIAAGDVGKLQGEIKAAKKRFKLREDAQVMSCYEAGRDGFWLHRYLTASGINNQVVDSSSIEVKRRARRAKTDRLDVEKLMKMLIRYQEGEDKVWSVVRVPSAEEEDRRQLHRELKSLKKEKTRTTNRIRGLLASQGIRLESRMELTEKRLNSMRLFDDSRLLGGLKSRLRREWEHVVFLKQQIQALEAERRGALRKRQSADIEKVRQLGLLRGIGEHGSWVLVREFFGWRRFKNRREVGSLAGLSPTPYDSGATRYEQGISKAGNRHIRATAIELAWSWVRLQPDSRLTQWFENRFSPGGKRARKVGIVALARRLLIELWKFLETGVIPEGAQLKSAAR